MSSRHSASRRRTYGRREHDLRERTHGNRRPTRDEVRRMAPEGVDATGHETGQAARD